MKTGKSKKGMGFRLPRVKRPISEFLLTAFLCGDEALLDEWALQIADSDKAERLLMIHRLVQDLLNLSPKSLAEVARYASNRAAKERRKLCKQTFGCWKRPLPTA